jgi:hypothetical protein
VYSAWKAAVLPLYYTRETIDNIAFFASVRILFCK